MDKIILVGGFNEIIELVEENSFKIFGIIDEANTVSKKYKYLGNDNDAKFLNEDLKSIPIVITPDLPIVRKRLHKYYKENNFHFISVISKKARISLSAKINLGVVVQAGVNISANALIAKFVKLNTNCNIMHNSKIGSYTTIAPNAVILGNVSIGNNCYIGANSTILPNVYLCNDVIIGAGAVVTKNIYNKGTYVGIPAKQL